MINLIWAMDVNNLIGKDNKIPWHVKEDLLYYKDCTNGKTVLMGENTYYSLKGYYKDRPLPYGKIYIASLDKSLSVNDAEVIDDVVKFLAKVDFDLFVVGGRTIYKLALPFADGLYISYIKGEYTGDTYFPEFDLNKYNETSSRETEKVTYKIYKRK